MGVLSFVSDPMGKRYRKKSWGQALGITAAKKRFNKTVFGPFRALSPSRHWNNFKQRVARKVGLRSEVAKAYRTGQWGKYVKRKVFESEVNASMIYYPFKRVNLRENAGYGDIVAHYNDYEHNSQQRGPQHRGIFKKLGHAVALGAIVGLGAHGARRLAQVHKASGTLSGRAVGYVKHVANAAHGHAKNAFDRAGEGVANAAEWHASSRVDKFFKKHFKDSATTGLIMPIRENFHQYHHEQHQPRSTFAAKVIAAGAAAGTLAVGWKAGKHIINPEGLARRLAHHEFQGARHSYLAANSGMLGLGHKARSAVHGIKAQALKGLSAVASVVHGEDTINKATHAYHDQGAREVLGMVHGHKSHYDLKLEPARDMAHSERRVARVSKAMQAPSVTATSNFTDHQNELNKEYQRLKTEGGRERGKKLYADEHPPEKAPEPTPQTGFKTTQSHAPPVYKGASPMIRPPRLPKTFRAHRGRSKKK